MILHICERRAWDLARSKGIYHPASLESEGFIHTSRPDQVLDVANRFYGATPDLVLLWINPHLVQAPIHNEPADGDTYPHIYGPLNLDAVFAVQDFPAGADGFFRELPVLQ
jgi:uncharacterized protein (DUF952 family)